MVNDGFVGVRISEATHNMLKREARERSISMHELIVLSVERYTGKGLVSTKEMIPAPTATLSGIAQKLNALEVKLGEFIAPHGKRSLKEDIANADAAFWHSLGLNSTVEDYDLLKEAVAEYRDRHGAAASGQLILNEGVMRASI